MEEATLSHLPSTIKFIVGQEFCERFSYYGMRAILALYLNEQLKLSENSSTELVHLFIVAAYIAPVLGAYLSDGLIGKYKTIMYLSIVYCLGNWTLSTSALNFPLAISKHVALLGLFLIALGTGGIKPCVCSFGGDQIQLGFEAGSHRDGLLRLFFSAFYFSINVGSTFSTVLTPWTRTAFKSYFLAFSLPAVLMMVATFLFWMGRKSYVHQPPSGSLLSEVFGIILEALKLKFAWKTSEFKGKLEQDVKAPLIEGSQRLKRESSATESKEHWLDKAKPKYGDYAVEDVKLLLQVLVLFIPVPIFWSLFDQQASRWVFQAEKMNGNVFGLTIEPDQMQTANSVLILIMIPLFNQAIYPFLERNGFSLLPIRRMVAGMVLGGLAFVVSGGLQIWIDSRGEDVDSSISMLWQLPQYIVMTAGEILFSITGLELAYSQAPASMTSVVQSFWLLTVAFGNLFTVLVVGTVGRYLTRAQEFFFFAAGCGVAVGLLLFVGRGFSYVTLVNRIEDSNKRSASEDA